MNIYLNIITRTDNQQRSNSYIKTNQRGLILHTITDRTNVPNYNIYSVGGGHTQICPFSLTSTCTPNTQTEQKSHHKRKYQNYTYRFLCLFTLIWLPFIGDIVFHDSHLKVFLLLSYSILQIQHVPVNVDVYFIFVSSMGGM